MSAPASAFDPVAFIEKTIEDLNHNAAIAADVACSARPGNAAGGCRHADDGERP